MKTAPSLFAVLSAIHAERGKGRIDYFNPNDQTVTACRTSCQPHRRRYSLSYCKTGAVVRYLGTVRRFTLDA